MKNKIFKVAILVDLNFLRRELMSMIKKGELCNKSLADQLDHEKYLSYVKGCLKDNEYCFRTFFYDSYPFAPSEKRPRKHFITDEEITPDRAFISKRSEELDNLSKSTGVAFRCGETKMNGVSLSRKKMNEIKNAFKKDKTLKDVRISPEDFMPVYNQKRVDIKIGLDVAWLSSKNLVDKIILVAGDTDFIPAMKHARREGVEVILATTQNVTEQLLIHSDEKRDIIFKDGKFNIS